MGKHFNPAEQEAARRMLGERETPTQIIARIASMRKRSRQEPPDPTATRRLLKGKTHCQNVPETRGRKRTASKRGAPRERPHGGTQLKEPASAQLVPN